MPNVYASHPSLDQVTPFEPKLHRNFRLDQLVEEQAPDPESVFPVHVEPAVNRGPRTHLHDRRGHRQHQNLPQVDMRP